MISIGFQGKPFNITVIQVYVLTSNVEEDEVEWFYEDLQDFLERTAKKDVLYKDSGSDWIPAEIFQILKDDAVKVLQIITMVWSLT